ncbi:sigma factor [Frigoriglobus tundricola]|uniref:RNA polymerase sigma-70 region 2 domain-containing protein n=1 Tax=Frigoriglobus tundricola TaxID=2774151 RepID=A0A6M5YLD2_9BACT|nr:sigma factor [Frigoriglobus tundricola]QJW94735.1 hypothetical protein FTUN_2257 [Frigoriglobus tundricola]
MSDNLFDIETPAPLNSLSELERMTLVDECKRTCAKEARAASRKTRAHAFEDLEQEALLACVIASRRWSPTMGTKFNTFATACVRRHLANIVTKSSGKVAVHIEGWDAVGQPVQEESEEEAEPLTPEQVMALKRVDDPLRKDPDIAFKVVNLLVSERLSVPQIAIQLGREEKDIKLIARNAAKALPKALRWAYSPGLFDEVA